MKPFHRVQKPIECDFLTIDLGGPAGENVKYIHIFGYSYKSSSSEFVTPDNPDGIYWANMECSGFFEPLAEFVLNLKANPNYVDDVYCEINQYQGDLTAEEMTDTINGYFNGYPANYEIASFEELTEDSPCGNYVRPY